MRKLFIILTVLFAGLTAEAQLLSFGIRGGVSSSVIKAEDLTAGDYLIETFDPLIGFHAGFVTRIKISKLFVQPELLFSSSGGMVKVSDLNSGDYDYKAQKYNKIAIPVIAGIKTGPLRLGAGPVASFTLSEKSDLFKTDSYTQDFKKATIGFQAGVGFDIKKLALDLKYEGSLSKLGSGLTVGNTTYPYDIRTSQWIVSLGLFF